MAIRTVVTRGYGSGASIALVVVRGYKAGAGGAANPHLKFQKLWPLGLRSHTQL